MRHMRTCGSRLWHVDPNEDIWHHCPTRAYAIAATAIAEAEVLERNYASRWDLDLAS